jgi:hypothetical protein
MSGQNCLLLNRIDVPHQNGVLFVHLGAGQRLDSSGGEQSAVGMEDDRADVALMALKFQRPDHRGIRPQVIKAHLAVKATRERLRPGRVEDQSR